MAPNPYDTCPCGSGKKFKFCCEKYFDKIDQAMNLSQAGQHESALRTMEQVTREHPGYAPVWGYYAQLLFSEGQIEKADEVIGKGFEIDRNFAMGHFLRGIFRLQEGERIGALLLFRKAAEAYDPGATQQLAQIYELIAENEFMLQHPVACRAAMERVQHYTPDDPEVAQQVARVFGPESSLPEAARKQYRLRPTVQPVAVDQFTGRFSEARRIYEELTVAVPDDPAAWFNLGLIRAWTGEQPSALEALLKSIEREWDDAKAEEAGALAEVIRCGQGMENDSDYLQYGAVLQIRDTNAFLNVLKSWDQARKLTGVQTDEQSRQMTAFFVDEIPTLVETGNKLGKYRGSLHIGNGLIRVSSHDPEQTAHIVQEIRDQAGLGVSEPSTFTLPQGIADILLPSLLMPMYITNPQEVQAKIQEASRNYWEEIWSHRPLRSLNGVSPIDAVGSKNLRKRLLGIIKFLSDCVTAMIPPEQRTTPNVYDFDRLRHKLGVEIQPPGAAPTIAVAATAHTSTTPMDSADPAKPAARREFGAMNVAELAAVDLTALSVSELDEAMRAAVKLDARDLAVRFAAAGTEKPADPAKPDRYTLYACLITGAVSNGDWDAALNAAQAGQKYDAEHNEARRANEFALQKAKLLAKRGDSNAAAAEFDTLIARNPDEGKFYIAAMETMLSARNGTQALRFAELGLAQARSTGNRDLEGACQELSEAARRLA